MGSGEATQYHCTPGMCRIQHGPAMENCLALRFSKSYNEPAKKHLVCTNSLLSSVQAFIMSVTLLLQNPLVSETNKKRRLYFSSHSYTNSWEANLLIIKEKRMTLPSKSQPSLFTFTHLFINFIPYVC